MRTSDTLDGAAILISCLPAADAEQLLRRMPEKEAEAIRDRDTANHMPPAMRVATARRFIREMAQMRPHGQSHRLDAAQTPASFHYLARQLPSRLADVLALELPGVTAAVLSILPVSKAADVLTLLPEDYQREVVQHVLCSGPVAEDVLRDLVDSLVGIIAKRMDPMCGGQQGRERLVELLQCTDAATRQRLAAAIRRDGMDWDASEPGTP